MYNEMTSEAYTKTIPTDKCNIATNKSNSIVRHEKQDNEHEEELLNHGASERPHVCAPFIAAT